MSIHSFVIIDKVKIIFYMSLIFFKCFSTVKNNNNKVIVSTVISPNFLVWKFCGKAEFLSA